MTEENWVPPSLRYKEIAATATTAAKRMRQYEREQVERLQEELSSARQRIADAEARRDEIAETAQHRWRAAMEALWDERWLQVTTFPEPDRSAAPAEGTAQPASRPVQPIQAAYLALHEALNRSRSWWPATGRSHHAE